MLEKFVEQLVATSWVEWLGMVTGILGVWLSIKEKVTAWPFFIACYGCYVYISLDFNLHAFMVMNLAFIGVSAYGWINWGRVSIGEALPIRKSTRGELLRIAVFLVGFTFAMGYFLGKGGESALPYLDAFAATTAFAAQWMLSRKQIETWLLWLVSDFVYLGIFFQNQAWPSVLLFAVFIGLAIKGWRDWKLELESSYT
ncbi:MAG: nicotinamide riboside transporter PnuC [Verrucomicrobiota bacterium]